MAQSSSPTQHPLKGKWFFFYQKAKAQRGQYDLEEGDYVTTVEQLFSVFRALPPVTLLCGNDSVVFSRDKAAPQYESFPNGYRVSVFSRAKIQLDTLLPRLLGAVVGEAILQSFEDVPDPKPQCVVIRFTHKPYASYKDSTSVDIWFSENPYKDRVEEYFKQLIKSAPGVSYSIRPLKEKEETTKVETEKSTTDKSTS